MERLKPVDAVIVGGGWTGLLFAKEITSRTPLSVVVLERGGAAARPPEYATKMDELDYNIRLRMMQNIADETVTHRHSGKDTAAPVRQYGSFHPGTGVGGAGEHWGGVSNRFLPEQFVLASHLRQKFGSDKLPENIAVQDWGVTYDDLELYYGQAELMMGVCGKAGNIKGKLLEGGNKLEGVRSFEYPNPPHKMSYLMSLFQKASVDLGYQPYPIPTATLSQNYANPDGIKRPACLCCGYCGRYGCMIGAKAQPSTTLLPLLENKKNFTLRPGCWVRRVVHRNGKAEGVSYVDASGKEFLQPADVVVLSSWTLNNTRLLLLSAIGERYDSTTNKGTLGKNLTHQVSHGVHLYFDKPLNNFMGAGGLGLGLADFEGDLDQKEAPGVMVGGAIRATSGGEGPIGSFGRIPEGESKSNWGSDWKKSAINWYDRAGEIMAEAAHLAYRQNFMDLDPVYTDKFGDPLLRLTLDWTDHEKRQAAFLTKIEMAVGKAMGAKVGGIARGVHEHYDVTYYQSTHVQGGVIMGDSPERSVVNPWLQHWHMPNLWITGGSTFPQNGSGNPTLTMLAATYRAADAFVNRYVKRPGALS
jgi:gluconate 2-dehydrogenase alpha chain